MTNIFGIDSILAAVAYSTVYLYSPLSRLWRDPPSKHE